MKGHYQYPDTINIGAGISGDKVILPLFVNQNCSARLTCICWKTSLNTEVVENHFNRNGCSLLDKASVHFQHNGARHSGALVSQWLETEFQNLKHALVFKEMFSQNYVTSLDENYNILDIHSIDIYLCSKKNQSK